MNVIMFSTGDYSSIAVCLTLATTYVCSLYIWGTNQHGDHPETIKKRFISVLFMTVISPIFVHYGTNQDQNIFNVIGLHFNGLLPATILPLLLTMILFIGPLVLHYLDGVCNLYFNSQYWRSNFKNIIWLRTHLVAPFSEELTFRACMVPILRQQYSDTASVFICPLFFGIAHLHHMIDRVQRGMSITDALKVSVFQFLYTTLFGMYTAFLFIRTGHLMAPFIVHAFCNHMGFPDFGEVLAYPQPKRFYLSCTFVVGLATWMLLLVPMTRPALYGHL